MPSDQRSSSGIRVCAIGDHPIVSFAADELAYYLGHLVPSTVTRGKPSSLDSPNTLCVGITDDSSNLSSPRMADPAMDDAIVIDCKGASGAITGINPRSALLAVYRYLTELGCRWVRPGADGEYIPRFDTLPDVRVSEAPSYRHRAVCIEGAVSYEHVRDMIDWLPKLGFNGYFVQFREAHTFFNRWYSHEGNPFAEADPFTIEQAAEYTKQIEREITKRGLLYHKVGHGWTCEPFGMRGLGWEKEAGDPSPEVIPYLAEVNGERRLWGGVALNTNLCYSNTEVRRIMSNAIASYAQANPHIDLLHVWLADGSNNNCECAACREARPSDFYVCLLNEVDEALTRKGLATRIVFLIYVDLLWPPVSERLRNPDRFVLMFAPIARTYSETFRVGAALPELPPFERNKLSFPRDVAANVAFLRAWQKEFAGDSFDFDYHLMWDHSYDPGHIHISQTIHEDMKGLRAIGLNGFVSCQIQRLFFPTGLPMTVMGRTLWDSNVSFDRIARDYFDSALGTDGGVCRTYLARLSALFDPPFLRGERPGEEEGAARRLGKVEECIESFRPVIERNLTLANACHAKSWRYLKHHAEIAASLANALKAQAAGEQTAAAVLWEETKTLAWRKEPELHQVFDGWLFTSTLSRRMFR